MTGLAWDRFRRDVLTETLATAPEQLSRPSWSSEQVERAQRADLRRLLLHAAEHSPFHARRLSGIDLASIDPTDISVLPVMTKTDMMDALDDVFTDRRLHRSDVESALAATGCEPVPILDDYIALASGGCSGRRAIFVLNRATATSFINAVARPPITDPAPPDTTRPGGLRIALVGAPSAVHATGFCAALTSSEAWPTRFELVPATLPIAEIVNRLNTLQPPVLGGYASILARLALEARAGRLRIVPAQVSSTSETLLPEMRSVISDAFGVPVLDSFACTEGLVGKAAPDDDVFVFNTDMCIVELVDADRCPVAPGVPSAKVLVTNLYNLTQPLIRYELTDVFIREPDAAGHGHLRARVKGRSDDVLHYDAGDVHPIVIRSVMVASPGVIDYQVNQTRRGIDVFAVTSAGLDIEGLAFRLRRALADAGLDHADVTVHRVEQIDRHPISGKMRRFSPIPTA
jgi:phenylacetate-coenzyme A ligase PaaK-like adenylate-forming protein